MKLIPIPDRFFEMIEGEMYVFMKAIKEAGLSVGYYQNLNSEGSDKTMLHPKNKKIILVKYDCISEVNKKKIIDRFGCTPHEFIARQPIRLMITQHNASRQFFLSYRYNEKTLPIHRVKQYSRACDILELIKAVDESRNKLIKELSISVPQFYDHLKAIIQEEQKNGESETYEGANQLYTRFPYHYVSLRDKVKEYCEKGYACVIDKAYGNTGALKVKDDEAKDFLINLLKKPEQYNDVLVCMIYNTKAESEGWKTITPPTVQNWRKENEAEIMPEREGAAAYNDKFIRQAKGFTPTSPLWLAEHDDYNHNLLSRDEQGDQYHRYVSIIVTDSYNNLPLGRSTILGSNPQTWQVPHAYLDAMYYIRSLTGGWYMPHEFKADRWKASYGQKTNKDGQKRVDTLDPFYNKLKTYSNVVPPALGNKRRGFIEQFFGSPFFKSCEKLVSSGNYNGNNMTAKNRGFSPDMLKKSFDEKSRPMIGDEAELQIEQFFYLLRHMSDFKRTDMKAPSKEQKWLQAWNEMTLEQKNPITDEQFLLTFGITHRPKHKNTIRITSRGVEPQIANEKYSYDLPETWMYNKLQGADVQVIYDPFDMSRVLVTNSDDIRFIAKSAQLAPRALKDQVPGSRTFLNFLLNKKKEQVKEVADRSTSRRVNNGNHAVAMLQSGAVLPKEIKNGAEQKMIEQFNQQVEEFNDERNDLTEFFQ